MMLLVRHPRRRRRTGGEEGRGQQQLANYRFSLIFKLNFIFN
jgi:hypothetical protein